MSNRPEADVKEGMSLDQRLAVNALERAFPDGYVLVHSQAWHTRAENPMIEAVLSAATAAALQNLLTKAANRMGQLAAAHAARKIDLTKLKKV